MNFDHDAPSAPAQLGFFLETEKCLAISHPEVGSQILT